MQNEQSAGHTPGPWRVRRHAQRVAVLTCRDAINLGTTAGQYQYRIADARLIAAAPELLEALRMYERCRNHSRGDWSDVDAAARAAIAKAEGR